MNTSKDNTLLPQVIEDFIQWDIDKGIIPHSSPQQQWMKLFEEVIELYIALNPEIQSSESIKLNLVDLVHTLEDKGKLAPVKPTEAYLATVDAIGDSMKCLTTVSNLSGINLTRASYTALSVIVKRKGKYNPKTGIWEKMNE